MSNKLQNKLNKRIEEGTYRSLSSFEGLIDFCSNDYLGLAKVKSEGLVTTTFGSTGSRLITGNSTIAEECEDFLAKFYTAEAGLVFNSGYDANLGIFSSIPQKGDLVIYDEHIHASVRDGVRLSFAKSVSFAHNSLEDLEKKLQLDADVKYVAIESLYSMGGDLSPIVPIVQLCKKYGALLIIDEAHSGGLYGINGKGVCSALKIEDQIFIRLITFGKAYGSHGAVVLSNELTKSYLINFARSFIYTSALPTESFLRIQNMVKNESLDTLRNQLFENIFYFRKFMEVSRFHLSPEVNSPIQILTIGDVKKTNTLAENLRSNGFAVKAIVSPTVAKGEEGIRICLHSFNSSLEIKQLVQSILN